MPDPIRETTAPLTLRRDVDHAGDLEPGEFCYRRDGDRVKWLHFWPRDSSCALSAAIRPQHNDNGATWTLSGAEDAPTLFPSVDAKGVWHGFLTNGVARQ
jgi:hypothetical protein